MEGKKRVAAFCLMSTLLLISAGCGKKADENKPMEEVRTEAAGMDAAQLRSMALKYKDTILAKEADVKQMMDKLKDIPLTEQLGAEAKRIKDELESLQKSVQALRDRFQVYYDRLKEEKGDLSGLDI